jgi:hypothetical protein
MPARRQNKPVCERQIVLGSGEKWLRKAEN